MPEFKEKSKMGRPKAKPSRKILPKQAALVMKEKSIQQVDQYPKETDSGTGYATGQVEGLGRWAMDEAISHTPRPRQYRKNILKERSHTKHKQDPTESKVTQTAIRNLKCGSMQGARSRQQEENALKDRMASSVKGPFGQDTYRPDRHPKRSPEGYFPGQAPMGRLPEFSTLSRDRPAPENDRLLHPQGGIKGTGNFGERTRTIFKTRFSSALRPSAPAVKGKPPAARAAKKAARQTVQRQMTQRMVAQARRTAKSTMTATKKAAEVVVRAVAPLVSGLMGLFGGGVLVVILLLVAIVAAIVSSPFGIFFAGESSGGGSSPATVSVAEAVAQVNKEYNANLEELQAGGYDSIDVSGAAADWPDVLAVFAARYAAAKDGVDVATLDADRVSKLTATFWDMTAIASWVDTIDHPDSDPDDDTNDSWTEYILHITITAKTAEDMKAAYGFTVYQVSAMDELLTDRAALSSLAGSLAITNFDALTVLNSLPDDLSPDRRKAVETALQLVGKVNYFWGGKSYAIGWDSRWGQLTKVTSDGSSTTGTFRPFGLDCTGFIDWTLRNAGLPSDGHWYIGSNLTEVTQTEALPGDMALYPDASHIGMVVGRNSAGKLLICHCSSGSNNVVVTEFAASGFTDLGRPSIYIS